MARILIAEDSRAQAVQFKGWLEGNSHEVRLADNGAQALELLDAFDPDVVVTDMQMPEMDGLELVDRVRFQYPQIPIILMTAHGSEDLAVEALQHGAAAYVSKSKVNTTLVSTIGQVLGLVRADRNYAGLLSCLTRNELDFTLHNDPELIGPLADHVQQMLRALRLGDSIDRVRIGMALEHALLNALYRGNLEISDTELEAERESLVSGTPSLLQQRQSEKPYCDRNIYLRACLTADEARFVIRDEGPGFDTSQVPEPRDPRPLEREGGRGLVLMKSFMDEVAFNQQGNEVTLVKRRAEPSGTAPR